MATLPPEERKEFLKLVPEFVIELKSPTDRYSKLHAKMQQWMRNGVQLGWLIDPRKQTVAVYRAAESDPESRSGDNISGEGPVEGFTLDLKPIWEGLKDI